MPKICGNTRPYHLTALLAPLLAIACSESAGPQQIREIRAHWLPLCGPGADSSAARIDLQALGDFDPSPDTYEEFQADVVSAQSVFPTDTRAVLARADNGFSRWRGVADVGASGNVDVPLWPNGASCTLFDDAGAEEPFITADSSPAIGYAPSTSTVLVTGGGAANASALTIDLKTGAVRQVADSDGPRTARRNPTVTPLGADLLVSGGTDPDTGDVLDTADVFRTDTGRFETRVDLSGARMGHAALPLESGETLLVGGLDQSVRAMRKLEAISPDTLQYRISGLAQLGAARVDPTVLRLTTGEILVAGGRNDNVGPVSLLEWLDPTASRVVRTGDLGRFSLPATNRAFTAMPGGGVLAAGGCALRDPVDDDEVLICRDFCGADGGCPSSEVLWILPDGSVVQLEPLDVPAPLPTFVPGAGGRPWLIADQRWTSSPFTGIGNPPDVKHPPPVIRVFDPFLGRFQEPTPTLIPESAFFHLTPVPIDTGLFLWLVTGESPAFIRGFRHEPEE